MRKTLTGKKWSQEYRDIKALSEKEFQAILLKGRFPNNNTFPPLYELKPSYKYSKKEIKYLCPRSNKTPRKYTIPDSDSYNTLVDALKRCWNDIESVYVFRDPASIQSLILSNKKIIPLSATILKPQLAHEGLRGIYGTAIIKWKEFVEHYLYEDSIDFRYLLELDIKDFYSQIYVHSIPWALTGDKETCKDLCRSNRTIYKKMKSKKIEDALMGLQDKQTNGIPIGPLGSDVVGEIILCRVVKEVERSLRDVCYAGLRFKDDFKILCKNKEDAEKILETIADKLYEFDLYLNDDKTNITSDFSGLAIKQWYKKISKLPPINYDLKNGSPSKKELFNLERELFAVLAILKEKMEPSDGNFWFEFGKRYSKYLKVISNNYPEGKGRIITWFIEQLRDYPAHTGAIMDLMMSLISKRDSKHLKIIRQRLVKVSTQRNFDVCMIWMIYFIAEKYLSTMYEDDLDDIFDDMKKDISKISNDDIKNESIRLVEYIRKNRKKLKGFKPVSKSFKPEWTVVSGDYM